MRVLLCLSIGGLFVLSTPIIAGLLLGTLEGKFPQRPIETLEPRDVAVVLGGVFKQARSSRAFGDAGEPVDRVLHAARLYKSGKVHHIIVAGGSLPWHTRRVAEAELIGKLLTELGVPAHDQSHDLVSRNTNENALAVQKIWGDQKLRTGYLVTSASHMRRALAVFKRYEIDVLPAATDYLVTYPVGETALDFLPSSGALEMASIYFKERVGYWVYSARGWL